MKIIYWLTFVLLLSPNIWGDSLNNIDDINIASDSNLAILSIIFTQDPDYSSYDLSNPSRLIIDISNITIPERPFVMSYCRPIERVNFQPLPYDSNSICIIVEYLPGFDYLIDRSPKSLTIGFSPSAEDKSKKPHDIVRPSWLEQEINLVIDGGQISSALNLISKKAGFDIVISDLNEKPIWVNFQNVRVEDALQAILHSSGNSYYISGEVVVVTNESVNIKNELETRVYQLKYQSAENFKNVIKDILSSHGKIEVINQGNAEADKAKSRSRILLITDTSDKHKIIEKVIDQIDRRPRQIAISVKFIETNISDEKNLGVDWNKVIETQLTGADPFGTQGGNAESPGYSAYSSWPPEKGSFEYGTLTISEAKAVLNYLHDTGESRLLSDPSVTTSDGKKATISVTTTIPIQTVNRFSEGAVIQDIVTYEYKEVGIILNVTPFINEQGRITLICEPQVEEITGWVGPQDSQQPITTKRSVETEIVVVNGETVVIGGLYKESKITDESKLWLLGDIPLLGWLFKTENTTKNKTDLLIFITPEILE